MNLSKPKMLYIIGPNFCINSLAAESLKSLSKKYDILCISEGPTIKSLDFSHTAVSFKREPSIIRDIICLYQLIKIVYQNRTADKVILSTPKISFLASIACKLNFVPYIYLHRGAVYQNFHGIKFLLYKAIDFFIIKGSDNTTFISESLYRWVKKELKLVNIEYRRNYNSSKGVDLKKFIPRIKNTNSQEIVIGFCGRIAIDKGYNDLIKLIKRYSEDPNVVISVKGKIELTGKEKKFFEKLIEQKVIKYSCWDNQVINFYQSIDLLFFPSQREGFGNVLIEAAACGVPAICYKIPGVIDAVIENQSGYLIDVDEDIFRRLDLLLKNKNKLNEMSKKSRKVAESLFDQKKVLNDIHDAMRL